jgi:hypothetical protein
MPNTVYPSNQEIYIDPYNGKIFDFNNRESRVYLGRSINQLLKAFGDNCILNGLIITPSLSEDLNKLIVNISPGKAVLDTTLIEFKEETILEYDLSNIDLSNGYFVVSISFNYLHNIYDNYAKFKLVFINNNNTTNEIFIEQDKIILTKINLDLTQSQPEKYITYIKSTYTNIEYVTINNHEYKIFPADNINKNIIKSIYEMFF